MTNVDMVLIAALHLRKQDQDSGGSGIFTVKDVLALFSTSGPFPKMRGTSVISALGALRSNRRVVLSYTDDVLNARLYRLTAEGVAQAQDALRRRMAEIQAREVA